VSLTNGLPFAPWLVGACADSRGFLCAEGPRRSLVRVSRHPLTPPMLTLPLICSTRNDILSLVAHPTPAKVVHYAKPLSLSEPVNPTARFPSLDKVFDEELTISEKKPKAVVDAAGSAA
jgi:hypothetical protein